MASFRLVTLLLMLIDVVVRRSSLSADALSMDYYAMACPFAEIIVSSTVNQALQNDPTLAAALLRMHFHDCFVQGCDGSILIDTTKDNAAEKDSPANLSLRGYEIIDQAKQEIEDQCPGVVSCADILAMAARDAVLWAGGPIYVIPMGRKDGRRSKIEDTANLPPPFFNSSNLIRMFGQRGFTAQEMVVLSGAHTLGAARCSSFKNRLSKFDTTHEVDPSLDPSFARTLARTCTAGGDTAEAPFDRTRNSFDNAYFNALQMGGGVLTSDQSLFKHIINTAGGPIYVIPMGRRDGRRSKIEDTVNLPPPFFNSSNLIRMFGQRGFTAQEMVVLSGAHTLGAARCSSFKNRLSKFDTTHEVDPSLDPSFARTLARTCTAGGDTAEAPFDRTRNSFDNAYFNALQMGGGVLTSDQSLFTSPQTRGLVGAYAMNQARFFFDFSQAIVKMGLLDVKEGTAGEVRRDCRRVN